MDQATGAIVTLGLAFIGVAAIYQLSKGNAGLAKSVGSTTTTLGKTLFTAK